MYGVSDWRGKEEIKNFIFNNFPSGSIILDVGAGGGTYVALINEGKWYTMDAVEIYKPTADYIKPFYRNVFNQNICDFTAWKDIKYDLVIFGDVLEHLNVEDAIRVLERAKCYAKHIIISVPFLRAQDAKDTESPDNLNETHLQPDLTKDIFNQRYPGFYTLTCDENNGVFFI